jgi:hypothetical protein
MVEYYTFDVISNDGIRLIYPMDLSLIYHIKYEWNPANGGVGSGAVHAVCVCKSDSILPDLTAITELKYNAFATMILSVDKTTINAHSNNAPTITATLPAAKGTVNFKYTLPDNSTVNIVKTVDKSRQAICGPSDLSNFDVGKIKVVISSDTWFTPNLKRPEVTINAV